MDRLVIITTTEEFSIKNPEFHSYFHLLLQIYFQHNLITADEIFKWEKLALEDPQNLIKQKFLSLVI
jgi:hypothetical protein